ncbi:hypothetical protein V8C42DRAFT_356829 [Trichoderma barbatum]
MQTAGPRLKSHKKLIRDLMTQNFLTKVLALRTYEKAPALVALWNLKASKACGRPSKAGNDLYSATLDMVGGVAFGMEDTMSALRHEATHVQSTKPIFLETEGQPVFLSRARARPELYAL